jgi:ATP-binding cassette, subfamily B, bacterial
MNTNTHRAPAPPAPPPPSYGRLWRTYLRPHTGRVLWLGALLLLSIGLELAGPQVLRAFIDGAAGGASEEHLVALALLFIALAVVDQVLVAGSTYAGEDLGWRATNSMRTDLVRHCLDLDLAFHDRHTPGELIERIDGDVTAVASFFSAFVLYILWGVLLTAGILVLLFREDWRVGLALTLFCALAVVLLHRLRHLATPAWEADREGAARLFGFIEERLSGLPDLHANGAQEHTLRRYHELARDRFRRSLRAILLGATTLSVTGGLFLLGYILAFALGAALFRSGAITLGAVYLIFHYTQMLHLPLELLTRQVQDFQKAAAGLARVEALSRTHPTIPVAAPPGDGAPPDPALCLPAGPLTVAFRGVSFRYGEEREPVLRDVSFTLPAGRTLGVLGRTGSGKTTLTRLLFRFYDPQQGEVALGGVSLRALPPPEVRRRVGLVTQEVQLFRATVRDNLTLFAPGVDDARLRQSMEDAGLGPWLRKLPRGLDTLLGGAQGLSAGEAQLLALARAFLRAPGLVILDEASSRLDPATERRIERAVDALLRGRTGIVIAHRLTTVLRVDDILILGAGRVLEQGPRAALAADAGSRFSALLRTGELTEVLA